MIKEESTTNEGFTAEQIEKLRYNPPPITTLPEIAVVLQVHEKTVQRYIRQKRIPAMNRGKHNLLFNTAKVIKALEDCA